MTTGNSDSLFSMGKPKLITAYTSGTGNYVPTENNARCLVRLQGGGGGGSNGASAGGGGGAMVEFVIRIATSGIAYAVGAGGAAFSGHGGNTTFGQFLAMGGRGAPTGSTPGHGGILGMDSGSVDADSVTVSSGGLLTGVCGGAGGYLASGQVAGQPTPINSNYATNNGSGMFADFIPLLGNGQGAASGGNSFYGKGNPSNVAPVATAYGAGGGYFQAGSPGYIEIWDFGA